MYYNKQYVYKLIETNRFGKVINLIEANIHNWSTHDFENLISYNDLSKYFWRLGFYFKYHFSKIYTKKLKLTYYSSNIIYYYAENKYDGSINDKFVKLVMNDKMASTMMLKRILKYNFIAINNEVLKYILIPKYINMFDSLLREKFLNNKFQFTGYTSTNQSKNIKTILSEQQNMCYNFFEFFSSNNIYRIIKMSNSKYEPPNSRSEYKEILNYLVSDDIKNRIPTLYDKANKIINENEIKN